MAAGPGNRFIMPNQFSVGPAGLRSGAKLYFFATGTDTPQNTYADVGQTVPNTHPVVADSLGQFGDVFLVSSPSYRVTLTDSADVEVWTMDPVGPQQTISDGFPIGGLMPFAGSSVPSGWLLCSGAAISRSTFSNLFGVIGTTWGVGDGSTTFNVPDLRGRVAVGKDDMGGSAANRVTAGGSGVPGSTLGGVGGDQLLFGHFHTIIDPGHSHTVTDAGHAHEGPNGGKPFLIYVTTGGNSNIVNGNQVLGINATATATTGVTIDDNTTGVTMDTAGNGTAQNMQPTGIVNYLIFAGT